MAFFAKIIEKVPDGGFYEEKTIVFLSAPWVASIIEFVIILNACISLLVVISYFIEFRGVLRMKMKKQSTQTETLKSSNNMTA
jgi:hypothetical protein